MVSNTCYNTQYGSYQKWEIGNIIRALLIAESAITDQIEYNVYPLVAPENVYGDFIVYNRVKYEKAEVKGGVYQDEVIVALTLVCNDYDNSVVLASNVDNVLTGIHTLNNGVKIKIMLDNASETFADNKYIQQLDFKII